MVKAPRKNRRRTASVRTPRSRQASSASKPRRVGRARRISAQRAAEFEESMRRIDMTIAKLVRERRWADLEASLKSFDERVGVKVTVVVVHVIQSEALGPALDAFEKLDGTAVLN